MRSPGQLKAGNHRFTLRVDRRQRSYIVHVPPQVNSGRPLPVVLNFHGGGSHAAAFQKYTGMDAAADSFGFLAIYPNGTGSLKEWLLTWNAGDCCSYAQENGVDDVKFVRVLLADLERRVRVDSSRIYATGMSNGAMMAYRLAVEASDRIAAVAAVAGAMVVREFEPRRPVPIMHIHSLDDPRAPYAGGPGPPAPLTHRRVQHASVEQTIRRWLLFNGCDTVATITASLRLAAATGQQTATRLLYRAPGGGADVILWKLAGAGHVWPGGRAGYFPRLLGPSTRIIDANIEIWNFFSRHALPHEITAPPP